MGEVYCSWGLVRSAHLIMGTGYMNLIYLLILSIPRGWFSCFPHNNAINLYMRMRILNAFFIIFISYYLLILLALVIYELLLICCFIGLNILFFCFPDFSDAFLSLNNKKDGVLVQPHSYWIESVCWKLNEKIFKKRKSRQILVLYIYKTNADSFISVTNHTRDLCWHLNHPIKTLTTTYFSQ